MNVNLDQFTVETEARVYRQRRLARAEQERRLALLAAEPSPLTGLLARLATRCGDAMRAARSAFAALVNGGFPSSPGASVTTAFHEEK